GFLLLGGRAADLLGRRRLFLAGIVLFTLSSLLAGLAWSEGSLIAARSFQGLGAAVISPAALSILSTTFTEGRERNIALGVWGAVGGFGAAAGVLLGGVLTETLSWSCIFFVNVPVGVAAFFLAPRLLDESRDTTVKSFDALGAVLVTGGLVSLVYAITQSGRYGWGSGRTIGVIGAAVALLAAFGWWERRHAEPLMRFRILRTKPVAGANVGGPILATASASRSCRSRSLHSPASGPPRPGLRRVCSTRRSRSAVRSASQCCRRSQRRGPRMHSRTEPRCRRLSCMGSRARSWSVPASQRS